MPLRLFKLRNVATANVVGVMWAAAMFASAMCSGNFWRSAAATDSILRRPLSAANPPSSAAFGSGRPTCSRASSVAGTVTNVQFLVDGSMIGEATSAPYSATASNLGVGTHTLAAVAADNGGLKATNTITVTVTKVAPLPVTLSNAAYGVSGFSFSFGTQAGHDVRGYGSNNADPELITIFARVKNVDDVER